MIKTPYNNILVKRIKQDDEIKIGDKMYSYDNKFNELKNITIIGEVLGVPDNIIYDKMDYEHSMEWETSMELKVGDIVWFTYMAIKNALDGNDPKSIDGNPFIPYGSCVVAKRGDEVICLNGYVLVEPLDKDKLPFELSPMYEDNKNLNIGVIKHIGSVNKNYFDESMDDDIYSVGDLVMFEDINNILLEYDSHRYFEDKQLFRMQRRDLICKIL